MIELHSDILLRIDALLGLFALTLVITCFVLMTVNFLIGLVCFLTIVLAMAGAVKGYKKGYDTITGSDTTGTSSEHSA